MTRFRFASALFCSALAGGLLAAGCAEPPATITVNATAQDTIDPTLNAPAAAKPADTQGPAAGEPAEKGTALTARPLEAELATAPKTSPTDDPSSTVKLTRATYDEFQKLVASNPSQSVKYTLVDAWATYCGPCKENFPHLVEMHHKYGPQGLRVISISFDDPEDARAVKEAEEFLVSQKATNTNLLLNEESGLAFDKFDVNAIPAVFLYGPDGALLQRFTLDDPNKQFTYAEVEQVVKDLLAKAAAPPAP